MDLYENKSSPGYSYCMEPTIVFVQLGKNPSPSLSSMALSAKRGVRNIRIFLITDFPDYWRDFPGEIIEYQNKHRDEFISKFIKKYPELNSIAGGYWLYTLERLFALKRIYEVIPSTENFVHLESDVLSLLSDTDFDLLAEKVKRVACPRFSEERGIASVLFVPNEKDFERTLNSFTQILNEANPPSNDMDLLGICLNKGIIDELPSTPGAAWEDFQGQRVVFDGAAYGQYLFGQDPFHTNGRRISGFQNPYFEISMQQTNWRIEKSETQESSSLFFTKGGLSYRVLNLHIHCKISLAAPSSDSLQWLVAIREANGEIPRTSDLYQPNVIHTLKISLLNRFRIAKRKGLAKSLYAATRRRVRKIGKELWS
jgi:hypothetical protein